MIITREQLETNEAQRLAPYALLSRDSRGRQHPDDEPAYRTAFQRDRDRIVHSAAFRRLEYKTQVFVNDAGDYYRTRLTHTLEVAQIGRTIARALGANEDLVEVICLAHDLGHPPFGHAGERALDRLLKQAGDKDGFNHNVQSFRVVTVLEERYPGWRGLNLTFEALEGIIKHEASYDLSHLMDLDPKTRGSLEAQIANIVDELTYSAHDLDDGLLSGLLSPDMLDEVEILREVTARVGWKGGRLDEVTRHWIVREQIGLLVDDLLTTTSARIDKAKPKAPEDIARMKDNAVQFSAKRKKQSADLKRFLYANMYHSPSQITAARRADRIIEGLFRSYADEPRQLPNLAQTRAGAEGLHRCIADHIASLTDRSAALEYRRMYDALTGP